jgi:hypothetical protein
VERVKAGERTVSRCVNVQRSLSRVRPLISRRALMAGAVAAACAPLAAAAPSAGTAATIGFLTERSLPPSYLACSTAVSCASPRRAPRSTVVPPALLSNLKIWISEIEEDAGPGELYAKVVEASPTSSSGFVVRFTAMAPETTRYLRSRLGSR